MDYVEPPPEPRSKDREEKIEFRETAHQELLNSDFFIRSARVQDVGPILQLINAFAASNFLLPRGPQYVFENIRDFVVAIHDVENKLQASGSIKACAEPSIAACGSLHILWEDLAEIRSLAIQPELQNRGLGKKIVEYMKRDAKTLGVRWLFALTLAPDFFKALGFEAKDKEELPSKVWGECTRCPKYFECNEVGMILEI